MNYSVALMIVLFDLIGNLPLPYKIIETNSSLERFDKPYEGKVPCTQSLLVRGFSVDGKSGNVARNVPCPQGDRS